MRDKGYKKRLLAACLLLCAFVSGAAWQQPLKPPVGLFSWGPNWQENRRASLLETMKTLNITQLYQHVKQETLSDPSLKDFIKESRKRGVAVYYTTGDPSWGLDPDATALKQEVDALVAYQRQASKDARFAGIFFDVEPYLDDDWQDEGDASLQIFTEIMKDVYAYAREKNCSVILCLPYWLDGVNKDLVEELIASACDQVAIMNYDRKDEIKNLETEMRYAKRYEKPLICIFEFQPPGIYDLTENETYYTEGLPAAWKSYQQLYEHYAYEGMMFAYHQYNTMDELLAKLETMRKHCFLINIASWITLPGSLLMMLH